LFFVILERLCLSWFTFDIMMRIFTCPNSIYFIKSPLTILELLSIFTIYTCFLVPKTSTSITILYAARLIRVISLIRIANHASCLRTFSDTLIYCFREMISYIFYLFVFGFIFASGCYMIESNFYDTKFTSIPDAFWVNIYLN
jgi:hypothetical protein